MFLELIRIKNFKKEQLQSTDDYFEKFAENNPSVIEKAGIKHINLKKKSKDLKSKIQQNENEPIDQQIIDSGNINLDDIDFTHLHNHSQFSMLQSTIKIKDLVDKAFEYNMKAVAITDLGNMMGAFRFVDAVKKKNRVIREINESSEEKKV